MLLQECMSKCGCSHTCVCVHACVQVCVHVCVLRADFCPAYAALQEALHAGDLFPGGRRCWLPWASDSAAAGWPGLCQKCGECVRFLCGSAPQIVLLLPWLCPGRRAGVLPAAQREQLGCMACESLLSLEQFCTPGPASHSPLVQRWGSVLCILASLARFLHFQSWIHEVGKSPREFSIYGDVRYSIRLSYFLLL